MKKLNWLDKFAEEQAKKMNKVASTTKVAEQVIVSPEDVPNAQDGATIEFNGEQFTVVNANFSDEMGPGVVLEKAAAYEGLEQDPMGLSMGAPAEGVSTPSSQGQQYHYTKLDVEQTYDNDQDAAWGQESAPATEQMIATEDSTDRTTVPGHYTKSPDLNGGGVADSANTNVNPQTPGIVNDSTQPEGEFGSETVNDINEQSNFAPASPTEDAVQETPVAPAVENVTEDVPTVDAPVEEEVTEDAPVEEEVTEDAPVEEDKKLASNRILNRIYQKGSK